MGNKQGADNVIKVYAGTTVSKPKNPTKVTSIRWTVPETIPAGTVISVPTPANLYDCTTWTNYIDPASYSYFGYKGSAHTVSSTSKTVLVQTNRSATQNFAFDIDMEDY